MSSASEGFKDKSLASLVDHMAILNLAGDQTNTYLKGQMTLCFFLYITLLQVSAKYSTVLIFMVIFQELKWLQILI